MPKLRKAKLDAATEQQAIAFVRRYIELRGGLSRDELWLAASKQELCGQPELPDQWVRKYKEQISQLPQIKARFESMIPPEDLDRRLTDIQRKLETSITKGPLTWNKKAAARLFADAERGDAAGINFNGKPAGGPEGDTQRIDGYLDRVTGHMIADTTTSTANSPIRDHYDVLCKATNRVF